MSKKQGIRSQVSSLTNEIADNLTEEELYLSREMKNYLNDLATVICGDQCIRTNITVIRDEQTGLTACTDGNNVMLNCNSELCRFFIRPEDRFLAFLGLFFHEHAHVIYHDFNADTRAVGTLEKGNMFGTVPATNDEQEKIDLAEMLDALADPNLNCVLRMIYHTLDNIVMDYHDEEKMMEEYRGLSVESIMKTREALYATAMTLEQIEEGVREGNMSKLSAMYAVLLIYTRFGEVICSKEETLYNSDYAAMLQKISAYAEIAKFTDDTGIMYSQLNRIVLALWPYIREGLNEQKKPQDSQGNEQQKSDPLENSAQGNSLQPTAEQIQNVIEQLRKAEQSLSMTQDPSGQTSRKAGENALKAKRGHQSRGKENSVQRTGNSQESVGPQMERLRMKVAEELAQERVGKEQERIFAIDSRDALRKLAPHRRVPVKFDRNLAVTENDIRDYEEEMESVRLYSRHLRRQMEEIFRDMSLGSENRHKPFGKIFRAQDAYRQDGLFFANRKAPQNLPDMAIAVLVDESGSMTGVRNMMARKAAILLYDFASGLHIPIFIAGHDTSSSTVIYDRFIDFEKVSENDKYRLAKLRSSGCNRDGAALEITAAHLAARPEKAKLLIVINDGCPNHPSTYDYYGGEAAIEDIRSILQKYRCQDMEIIAAAIGDDKETIASIYGEGYLNIDDLSALPKTLTGLVKKRLLSQCM